MSTSNTNQIQAANPADLPPLPADHLDHPENWVTGGDPATEKQKAFVKTLESQHPDLVPKEGLDVEEMGKTEASEVIDNLKSGKPVEGSEKNGKSSIDIDGVTAATNGEPRTKRESTETGVEEEKVVEETDGMRSAGTEKTGEKRKASKVDGDHSSVEGEVKTDITSGAHENGHSTEIASSEEPKSKSKDAEDKNSKQTTLDDIVSEEKEESRRSKKARVEYSNEKGEIEGKSKISSKSTNPTENTASTDDNDIKSQAPIEVDVPVQSNGSSKSTTALENSVKNPAHDDKNGSTTLPGSENHLDHPENWTTGDEPATDKQKGYLKVLEKQKGVDAGDVTLLGKSEASEKIDEMKKM